MIPAPSIYLIFNKEEKLNLLNGFIIINSDFAPYCSEVFTLRIPAPTNSNIIIRLIKSNDTTTYNLLIQNNNISISGKDEQAIILGLTTLYNLHLEDKVINKTIIKDHALYLHRGLSFDSARHFFTITEIKKIIEEMSLIKLNVFHWHLSDDQGFRIESKLFPTLASPEHYTQDEIKDLDYYCKIRGIKIIPEIDMPGHVSSILSVYPKFSCFETATTISNLAGIYENVFCPSKPEVYSFINKLLGEISGLFMTDIIHLGGDEVPKYNYKHCDLCQQTMLENDLNNYEELQGYFLKRVSENINKKIILWNDSLLGNYLPDNSLIQFWLNKTVELKAYNKLKKPIIDSNMYVFYFDYPLALLPLKRVYKYKSPFNNIQGHEACLWSERITSNEELERMLFPRLYAVAEACWDNKKNYRVFLNNIELMKKAQRVLISENDLSRKHLKVERRKYWQTVLNMPTVSSSEKGKTSLKTQLDFFRYFMKFSDFKLIKEIKKKYEKH
ncbi:MAG: family 20 glycosylhydrolase [Bacillales bacterium]|jgi:hexosaminidase|nr:family 20 glycosylhydrolase [Bacillales bacterium]